MAGRGLATDSGDKLKYEEINVPYKRKNGSRETITTNNLQQAKIQIANMHLYKLSNTSKLINTTLGYVFFIFSILVILIGLNSCGEDGFTTNPDDMLTLSTDTITFDTVFTEIGSTSKYMTILNDNNKDIQTTIALAGGEQSQFRMNVSGEIGTYFEDVPILDNDSLYIFVEVTVDPNDNRQPFIYEDSLIITSNGNTQKVLLLAYGQNAVFFNNIEICDTTLTDDLPYVIYNFFYVPKDCELTLKEGVRFYVHKTAQVLIEGTLRIEGTKDSMVTFQGDRLEEYFTNRSAQWNGIELLRYGNVVSNYGHIKNGYYGFIAGVRTTEDIGQQNYSFENAPVLAMQNTIVENCFLNGLFGYLSVIEASNCLIQSCGEYNFAASYGGNYHFTNCTFANYGTRDLAHRDPIIAVGNAIEVNIDDVATVVTAPSDLYFGNCIVHGAETEEIAIGKAIEGGAPINYLFENCLLRTELNIDTVTFVNCIKNPSPSDTLFVDRSEWDYRLNALSPAIDLGSSDLSVQPIIGLFDFPPTTDFDGNARPIGDAIDVGCFEFVDE